MTEIDALRPWALGIPVDEELLAPLGRVMWAAIRLHHAVRDTLGLDLGAGLSDEPFEKYTLGGAISALRRSAAAAGDPWDPVIIRWADESGTPAANQRDRVAHAVAYTADDGRQALRTGGRKGLPRERVTTELLEEIASRLEHASVELYDARQRCRQEGTV